MFKKKELNYRIKACGCGEPYNLYNKTWIDKIKLKINICFDWFYWYCLTKYYYGFEIGVKDLTLGFIEIWRMKIE